MTQTTQHSNQPLQLLALELFDGAAAAHRLPRRARALLLIAAAYYSTAQQSQPEHANRAGRDLALARPIPELTPDEQAIAACAIAFQRDKVRPQREPAFLRLDDKDQRTALCLAAILRIADEISHAPRSSLLAHVEGGTTVLVVGGDGAVSAAAGAIKRADLWQEQIGALTIRAAEPAEPELVAAQANGHGQADGTTLDLALPRPGTTGVRIGDEPIAEEARRMLRRFFDKLLAREEAVRKDEDPEDVHQMRVATRRLRASLQVGEGIYDAKAIRRYRRGLRRVADSLGAVRDGDVFLEHVIEYRDGLPEDARARLSPLIAAVTAERAQARERLLATLEAKRYKKFKRDFATFLTTPGASALAMLESDLTARVRDFAGSAIWRRYEQWRAYEVVLPNASDELLHQARIAGKRLRYTLEFFSEALGPNVEQVLAPLVALQEKLGALQDGIAARAHIAALGMAEDHGALEYLAARTGEHDTHLADLPRLWEKVASATYRRRLFELIVKL